MPTVRSTSDQLNLEERNRRKTARNELQVGHRSRAALPRR